MAPTTRKNSATNKEASTAQPVVRLRRMRLLAASPSSPSSSISDLTDLEGPPAKRPRMQIEPARKTPEHDLAKVIRIAEAKSILPDFDGENMPVTLFIKECLEIAEIINASDKNLFTKLVRSKITGKARAYVNSRSYNNLQELLDTLRRAYFPQMDYYSLQTELSHIIQKPTETVSNYGLRLILLLNKSMDVIYEEHSGREKAENMIESATKNAIRCFLRGLKAEITTFIFNKNFDTLEQAIDEAVRLELKLNDRSKLFSNHYSDQAGVQKGPEYRQLVTPISDNRKVTVIRSDTTRRSDDIVCFRCGILGHIARNCPNEPSTSQGSGNSSLQTRGNKRNEDKSRYDANNASKSNDNGRNNDYARNNNSILEYKETRICYNCKGEGHLARQCPSPLKKCKHCDKPGHLEDKCFAKPRNENSKFAKPSGNQ